MVIHDANRPTPDLAGHFMECGKLGRYLTVFDESRFVITDDFSRGHKVEPAAAAMASVCSKDLLVARAALVPLGRAAGAKDNHFKARYEELFDLIENRALSREVKDTAQLMRESGFRPTRIQAIEAELGGKISPARKRYLSFLTVVRQLTEAQISPTAFRDEFLDFTYAVAGKLDFGIYSFCLDRIFGNARIPIEAKKLLTEEVIKYPPLIRRELLATILTANNRALDPLGLVRAAIHQQLDENVAMEVHLLEQLKSLRLSAHQIEDALIRRPFSEPA